MLGPTLFHLSDTCEAYSHGRAASSGRYMLMMSGVFGAGVTNSSPGNSNGIERSYYRRTRIGREQSLRIVNTKQYQTDFHLEKVYPWPCRLLSTDHVKNSNIFPNLPYLNVHDLEPRGLSSCTSMESARCLHASFSLSSLVLISSSFLERQFVHRPGRGR